AGVALLAGLIAGTILAGLGEEKPRARKPHQDEKGNDLKDNTKVLKLSTAIDVVEEVLIKDPGTRTALSAVIVRAFTKIFTTGHQAWHSVDELIADIDLIRQEVWGPLADLIQKRLREAVL